ncbi:unnamed protein product [Ectocarpus sp. 13 AM-2016]
MTSTGNSLTAVTLLAAAGVGATPSAHLAPKPMNSIRNRESKRPAVASCRNNDHSLSTALLPPPAVNTKQRTRLMLGGTAHSTPSATTFCVHERMGTIDCPKSEQEVQGIIINARQRVARPKYSEEKRERIKPFSRCTVHLLAIQLHAAMRIRLSPPSSRLRTHTPSSFPSAPCHFPLSAVSFTRYYSPSHPPLSPPRPAQRTNTPLKAWNTRACLAH